MQKTHPHSLPSLVPGLTPENSRAGRLAISRKRKKEKKGKGTENNQGKSAGKGGDGKVETQFLHNGIWRMRGKRGERE